MQSYRHFTLSERENLRVLEKEGKSIREIARILCRNPSSVSRELKRGSTQNGYNAWWATSEYIHRRKRCRRRLRFAQDAELTKFVEQCLGKYWSPEIITAKWKQVNSEAKLSHSTIYRALKSGQLSRYPAEKYLRRHNRLKYKKGNNQTIKPQHVISQRPEMIEKRERIGDWEADTMHGAKGKGSLVTCIERKTRYLTAALVKDMRAQTIGEAMCDSLRDKRIHTITLDRGSEFAGFCEIEQKLGCTIYFADPRSPWQRGSNENINGLLRFFFPKGTDFHRVTQHELDFVVDLINTRPRKCLDWLSPADFFFAKCCT